MFRIHTIRFKIFCGIFFVSIFILSVINIAINETYAKSLRTNEENYNILASDKLKTQLDSTIDLVERTADSLSSSSEIESLLEGSQKGKATSYNDLIGAHQFLNSIQSMQTFIKSIQVITMNGDICSTNTKVDSKITDDNYQRYYRQLITGTAGAKPYWTGLRVVENSPNNPSEVISYVYPVASTLTEKVDGMIIIDVSYEYIEEKFADFGIESNEKAFILDSSGEILLNYPRVTSFDPVLKFNPEIVKQSDIVLNRMVFGVNTIIVSRSLNTINWKVVRIIPTDSITAQTNEMEFYLKIIILISLVIGLFYSIWIASTITKPVQGLSNACKHIEQGDLSYHLQVKGKDELSQLGNTFNMMTNQLNLYLKRELDNQNQKANMQFQILQAQINPHFLYNTLDSIKWLAAVQNMSNIAEMCTALINLLKYNLSKNNESTTLGEEIESVKNYITIQKFRYLDTFEFTTRLDQDSLDCEVLRFILQPLVENSILHGFGNLEQNYKISIASFFSDDMLHIKVIDNGRGMDSAMVDQINFGVEDGKHFNNIGVKNIQQRIQLYFGGKYGLTYQSLPHTGTIAEITLPIKHLDEKQDIQKV